MSDTKANLLDNIIRPSVDENNCCVTDTGVIVSNCVVLDNGDIKGITSDNKKTMYVYDDNKWINGKEIRQLNLVSLKERTKDERLAIIAKANEAKRENIEKKKNFNELAKAMLEQVASEKQIKAVLGENTECMLDNSMGSLILASMIQGAVNGSFKCAEFVRDTAGFKPKNEVELSADIMTDADKSLIDKALKQA